jgi:hypothetical protein
MSRGLVCLDYLAHRHIILTDPNAVNFFLH